jgi:hypothetical protein
MLVIFLFSICWRERVKQQFSFSKMLLNAAGGGLRLGVESERGGRQRQRRRRITDQRVVVTELGLLEELSLIDIEGGWRRVAIGTRW